MGNFRKLPWKQYLQVEVKLNGTSARTSRIFTGEIIQKIYLFACQFCQKSDQISSQFEGEVAHNHIFHCTLLIFIVNLPVNFHAWEIPPKASWGRGEILGFLRNSGSLLNIRSRLTKTQIQTSYRTLFRYDDIQQKLVTVKHVVTKSTGIRRDYSR